MTPRSQSPSSNLRRPASRTSVSGAGGTNEAVDLEALALQSTRVVAFTDVVQQLGGDPRGHVVGEPGRSASPRGQQQRRSSRPLLVPGPRSWWSSINIARSPAGSGFFSSALAQELGRRALLDLEAQLIVVHPVHRGLVARLDRLPSSTIRESSFSTSRWIVRRRGRAPNSGSAPLSGEQPAPPPRRTRPRSAGPAAGG